MSIPMDENQFANIKKAFEARGGVISSSAEIDRHLDMMGADAATLNENTILIRHNTIPSASAIFEELIHTAQYRTGRAASGNWNDMEIEAKLKLIKYQKHYKIPDIENEITLQQLEKLINQREVT